MTQGCNNIVISWLYQTCWNNLATSLIISFSQTCWQLETSSANTTCWRHVCRLVTRYALYYLLRVYEYYLHWIPVLKIFENIQNGSRGHNLNYLKKTEQFDVFSEYPLLGRAEGPFIWSTEAIVHVLKLLTTRTKFSDIWLIILFIPSYSPDLAYCPWMLRVMAQGSLTLPATAHQIVTRSVMTIWAAAVAEYFM
jgi:hypothetical protein